MLAVAQSVTGVFMSPASLLNFPPQSQSIADIRRLPTSARHEFAHSLLHCVFIQVPNKQAGCHGGRGFADQQNQCCRLNALHDFSGASKQQDFSKLPFVSGAAVIKASFGDSGSTQQKVPNDRMRILEPGRDLGRTSRAAVEALQFCRLLCSHSILDRNYEPV
ncbi:MAG: hypothetical protein OXI01_14325 [Albidovulum sp.]|nr:hypothetical protein [Albidovulum sp.]